jgi:RHS repeat-associated protein
MRVGGALYFLHGDHLGSATLTTDASGNRIGELRYTPYGVTRYEWGNTPTNRRYTGQRWEGFGLYDYGARMYSPSWARFVSADVVVAAPGKPQSLNRYAYVYNSPLRYTDPSGLIAQQEAEHAQVIIDLLRREYWVFVRVDFGWRFLPVMHPAPGEPTAYVIWEEGMWQLAELEQLLEAVDDLASAMGGAERFRENLRGVLVERAVMRYAGLGAAHRIWLNAGGFTKWTVVHELAHAWDAARGWRLSKEMQEAMGAGFAHPIRHFFDPGNPAYWYDPGQGPPPCGIDANFKRGLC